MKPTPSNFRGKEFLFLVFGYCFFLQSCQHNVLTAAEYIQYVRNPDNGLTHTLSKNGYDLTVNFETCDYLTLKELRNETLTKDLFQKTRPKFSEYCYFDFIITPDSGSTLLDPKDTDSYDRKFRYLSFDLSQDVYITSHQDTLHCLLYQFIPGNGISPEYHFEMMFERPDSSVMQHDLLEFTYEDKILNLGKINFPFEINKLKKIPQLKI